MKKNGNNGFSLENFVPSWPASVMGTGIMPVAFFLAGKSIPVFKAAAYVFAAITFIMLILILSIWLVKLFRHPGQFRKELNHPVAGSFLPTMPIAVIIAAIDLLLIGPGIIGLELSLNIAYVMFIIGTAGIYLLSWIIMPALFQNSSVQPGHGTFGWYIPPVSHLIVPVIALELIHKGGGSVPELPLFIFSQISLGTGLFLFIFVGANVFYRYLYQTSPVGKMAPTLLIGLAPTSVLVIILVKMAAALPHLKFLSIGDITPAVQIIGTIMWGFSIWWLVLSILKTGYALIQGTLKFALSWWAFTFPLGALAVATGSINNLLKLQIFSILQVILTLFLFFVWLTVAVLTLKGISDGSIFNEE